jgi:hypothetical protein
MVYVNGTCTYLYLKKNTSAVKFLLVKTILV